MDISSDDQTPSKLPAGIWQDLLRHAYAQKLWHRGDRATARDLFDLALVIEREPQALTSAREYLVRHREVFLSQLEQRKAVLKLQFNAIDRLDHQVSYEQAQRLASEFLMSL